MGQKYGKESISRMLVELGSGFPSLSKLKSRSLQVLFYICCVPYNNP
jgi:hypothetical protein